MICVPCVLVPLFLVIWRFIQPFVLRFWNPFAKEGDKNSDKPKDITECSMFSSCPCLKKDKNNEQTESKEVTVEDKKDK